MKQYSPGVYQYINELNKVYTNRSYVFDDIINAELQNKNNIMVKWCEERFGKMIFDETLGKNFTFKKAFNKQGKWDHWGDVFYFKNSNDAMFFKLRWGE